MSDVCKYCDGTGYHKYNGKTCRCPIGRSIDSRNILNSMKQTDNDDVKIPENSMVIMEVDDIEALPMEMKANLRQILDYISDYRLDNKKSSEPSVVLISKKDFESISRIVLSWQVKGEES